MLPNLPYVPFTEYCFSYQAINSIKIPPFPNLLLHGAFGNALHHNICVLPNQEQYDKKCASCGLKDECAYTYLFKRQYLTQTHHFPKPSNSSPYVFRFSQQGNVHIPARHQFDLKMVIFGVANQKIDYFIHGMKVLGELGISRREAQLMSIRQIVPSALPVDIVHAQSHMPAMQPELPDMPRRVTVRFVTPCVFRDDMMHQPFDIGYWLMLIVRRISRLQNTYTEQPSEADFGYLKKLTQQAVIDKPELYFYETPQTKKTHSSGLLGSIELSLQGIEDLWPWLYLGQWFHVGKKTSNGNGRYELSVVAG